jgi:hypothetical protein
MLMDHANTGLDGIGRGVEYVLFAVNEDLP